MNYPSESKKRTTWILNCAGNSCKSWRKGNRGEFGQKPRVDFRTQHGGQERRVSITKSVLHRLKEWSLLHQKHMLRENMPSVILFAMMRYGKIAVETKEIWQGNGMTDRIWYISKSLNFCLGGQTYSCTFFRRMRKDIPCYFASKSKLPRFKPSSFIFPGWSDFLNYLMASCRLHFFPLNTWIVCKCVADGQTVQLNCGCITSIWLAGENGRFSLLLTA